MTAPIITAEAVGAALAGAVATINAAPRGATPEQVQAARDVWLWLALVPTRWAARIAEAKARGATFDAIGARLELPAHEVERQHAKALAAIATRLNEALAGAG